MKEAYLRSENFIIYVIRLLNPFLVSDLMQELYKYYEKQAQSLKLDWVPAITKEDGSPTSNKRRRNLKLHVFN